MQKRLNPFDMKKLLGILVLAFVLYQSVYFESLTVHQRNLSGQVDYQTRCEEIVQAGVVKNPLVQEEASFLAAINQDFPKAKQRWGNRLGIGESAYFLVKGRSQITSLTDGQIQLASGSILDTKYIFGNAVRDASRQVRLEDFHSQKELNGLTAALNTWLRDQKIPAEMKHLKVGDEINYIGAVEVGPLDLPVQSLTIYPVTIQP